MAELLLKIGDGANYQCGDVLCAFTEDRIADVAAQHLCKLSESDYNGSGLVRVQSLAYALFRAKYTQRFERVSPTEVMKRTGSREKLIRIRGLRERIARMRKSNALLFGEDGNEIWFGGTQINAVNNARLWQEIKDKHGVDVLSQECQRWSFGSVEIRSHLAIRCESITDKQAESLAEPLYKTNDNGEYCWCKEDRMVYAMDCPEPGFKKVCEAKRRRQINWRRLLGDIGETEQQVFDMHRNVGSQVTDKIGTRWITKNQRNQNSMGLATKKGRQ